MRGGDSRVLEALGLGSRPAARPAAGQAGDAPRLGVVESIDPKAQVNLSAIKARHTTLTRSHQVTRPHRISPPGGAQGRATKAHIKRTVGGNLLFQALDAGAARGGGAEHGAGGAAQGEAIITQGEEGNHFYVVDRRRSA